MQCIDVNDSPARLWAPFAIVVATALACGCGPSETGGVVQGKVTYKGAPLALGSILFVPESGPTATANFQPDGSYRLLNAHKTEFIAPGAYRVVVIPGSADKRALPESKGAGALPIPIEFTSTTTTPLRYEVKDGPNAFDIDLSAVPAKGKAAK